jgi:hypothetical protein
MLRDVAHHHALALPLTMAFRAPHSREHHVIGYRLESPQLAVTIRSDS